MNHTFKTQANLVSRWGAISYSEEMDAGAEVLVFDQPEPCPYLPGKTARLPLRMPLAPLTGAQFDARMAAGDRRAGPFLYTMACEQCRACEPLRLNIDTFAPSRTQQRVWKRGQQLCRLEVRAPVVDDEHVALYNKHRRERELDHNRPPIDESGYADFLARTCCETLELAYFRDEKLVMVAIVDVGATAVSAVYTFFDPAEERWSPGVYSIMQQIDLCRQWRKQYLYLGLYIAESVHMKYKAQYQPHERRIQGQWHGFA